MLPDAFAYVAVHSPTDVHCMCGVDGAWSRRRRGCQGTFGVFESEAVVMTPVTLAAPLLISKRASG